MSATELISNLTHSGVTRGSVLAVAVSPQGLALASEMGMWQVPTTAAFAAIGELETHFRPRWVWWSAVSMAALVEADIRVAMCWDLAAVHRLLFGGWRAETALVWAALHGLSEASIPAMGQLGLLDAVVDEGVDVDNPVRPDGHIRPEWISGRSQSSLQHLEVWAGITLRAYLLQREKINELANPTVVRTTAHSESLAEFLCIELAHDGLPIDVPQAERLLFASVGPRPTSETDAMAESRKRDSIALAHLPAGVATDLRNPAQVRSMLRRIGVDVPDTRAGRLEAFRGVHPFVDALLVWRKAERLSTTYGYRWLDQHVGSDGRLRGAWTGSDGAAGRMTAQAGLHNLPAELREAVVAEDGFVFVHADLGQIEPRVLAVVSGDEALISAAQQDDLYAPVATRLKMERAVAKVAVLGAMYGATSGVAGEALKGLERAYPTAMKFLDDAYRTGLYGIDIRTYGGRLVRMQPQRAASEVAEERSAAAAQGRYARNAMIQGAAAELFKAWAVTLRGRVAPFGARIVLCLHDELLIHTPIGNAEAVANLVEPALHDAAQRWMPGSTVRYVAVATMIERWSDAK